MFKSFMFDVQCINILYAFTKETGSFIISRISVNLCTFQSCQQSSGGYLVGLYLTTKRTCAIPLFDIHLCSDANDAAITMASGNAGCATSVALGYDSSLSG